jgi:hypothetical protein
VNHFLARKLVTMTLETAAVAIVGLIGLNLALKAGIHLFKTFLRPAKDLKKFGKWAVVTGATGKIFMGSCFACIDS